MLKRRPKPQAKTVTAIQPWLDATVRVGESHRARHGRIRTDANETIERAAGVVLAIAMRISQDVSSARIRLYRPAGGVNITRRTYRGEQVTSRKALNWLRNPACGTKAAIDADRAGDIEEVMDHPILDLIDKPNPWQNGREFRRLTHLYRLICGRAFYQIVARPVPGVHIGRGKGSARVLPTDMLMMAPQHTEVIPGDTSLIAGYHYGRNTIKSATFEADEVIYHRHTPSPFEPWGAIGPLHAVHQDADIVAAAALSEIHRWENESRPDIFISTEDTYTDLETLRKAIEDQVKGIANKGRFLLGRLMDIKQLGFPPKDMEYQGGRRLSTEDILAAYGYPESMYRLNDANLASSKTGHIQYQRFTILPELVAWCETMNETLLPMYGCDGDLWLAPDNPVDSDELAEAQAMEIRLRTGRSTIAEERQLAGDDAYPDGLGRAPRINGVIMTEVPFSPSFQIPYGFTPTPFGMPGSFMPGMQVPQGFQRPQMSLPPSFGAPAAGGGVPPQFQAASWNDGDWKSWAFKGPRLKRDDAAADRRLSGPEAEMIDALTAFLLDAIPAMTEAVVGAAGLQPSLPDGLFRRFAETVTGPMMAALEAGAALGERDIRGRSVKQVEELTEAARGVIERERLRLADSLFQSLEARIRELLSEGVQAGESISQLQQRVADAVSQEASFAAERIARTESRRAFMVGRQEAWAESGVVAGKRWVLSGNACPICIEINSRFPKARLNEPFVGLGEVVAGRPVTYRPIEGGDAHPMCRCSVEPILEGEE